MDTSHRTVPTTAPGSPKGPAPRLHAAPPKRRVRGRSNPIAGIASFLWLIVVLVPIYTMISSSLTRHDESIGHNALKPPPHPTLDNYRLVLDNGFLHFLWNTVIVALGVVAIVVVLSVPLAYAVVRTRDRWTNSTFRLFILGVAIPSQAVVVPLYLLMTKMGLYDQLLAIILPTAAFAMPVSVLILVGTLRDISEEVYEAMALDGASPTRMLFTLVIPMSKGGISTVIIYSALQAWNGLLFPLIFTQSEGPRVLTLGLFNYVTQFGVNVPALLASVVLSGIPIFAVYLVARRALVNGMMGMGGK